MNEIIRHFQTIRSISKGYLETIDISKPLSPHDIFDVLSRNVAVSYLETRFPLPVGFDLMQKLVRLSNFDLSPYTWDIFDAFACGAYRTDAYPIDLDPAIHHTIPRLHEILNRRRDRFFATQTANPHTI